MFVVESGSTLLYEPLLTIVAVRCMGYKKGEEVVSTGECIGEKRSGLVKKGKNVGGGVSVG